MSRRIHRLCGHCVRCSTAWTMDSEDALWKTKEFKERSWRAQFCTSSESVSRSDTFQMWGLLQCQDISNMDAKSCYINWVNYWLLKAPHHITNWLLGTVVPKPRDHWQWTGYRESKWEQSYNSKTTALQFLLQSIWFQKKIILL